MTTETILTLEQIHHLWDTRVIEPTEAYPLVASDKIVFARAIEQAVLQSPEIQVLRKDAERLDFLISEGCTVDSWIQSDRPTEYRLEWDMGGEVTEWQESWFDSPREAIDAAMESQT